MIQPRLLVCAIFIALVVSACMSLKQYHPLSSEINRYQVCTISLPGCENTTLQKYRVSDYMLGSIEARRDTPAILHSVRDHFHDSPEEEAVCQLTS